MCSSPIRAEKSRPQALLQGLGKSGVLLSPCAYTEKKLVVWGGKFHRLAKGPSALTMGDQMSAFVDPRHQLSCGLFKPLG